MNNINKSIAAAVIAVAGMGSASHAATVDTVLSLVIDVSGSISPGEYNLQMDGYANAFRNGSVQTGILDMSNIGDTGSIAVNVVQFGTSAVEALGFRILDSFAAIDAFANELDNLGRNNGSGSSTNIADGISLGTSTITSWLGTAGNAAARAVIDVSGDGTQNVNGFSVTGARDAACNGGIDAVNGVTIGSSSSLPTYFADNVQCGTDSFTLAAIDFNTFENVVTTKLRAEITGVNPVPVPASALLLLTGIGGVAALKRRKKKSAS
ncbi:DUF1194 domain-containing protein [Roseobacter sp. OBYS 0001]|uniref:DUF1194 domain-containing protein n=1 Tax=Roseobacter sp. OBYS 0001 TaxID=882651 RepID=UPI001BC0316A|nr:DUF1194 domain-containing protein [Roseobacter sp. OBYS 0001]GIT85131.1 hypothetical protein ROBYS_01470 [Roseobacter sp. OBYS 0001]